MSRSYRVGLGESIWNSSLFLLRFESHFSGYYFAALLMVSPPRYTWAMKER
ncbi:hypothetical protein CIHG_09588 [Coccidioides immitis H538.4]|nr:hypothetical protein CIHG_09588 [Coccidioides immitis H538.4]